MYKRFELWSNKRNIFLLGAFLFLLLLSLSKPSFSPADNYDLPTVIDFLRAQAEFSKKTAVRFRLTKYQRWSHMTSVLGVRKIVKDDSLTPRSMSIFWARSNDKVRCDVFSEDNSITDKYIFAAGKKISASGFGSNNPHVFIEELKTRGELIGIEDFFLASELVLLKLQDKSFLFKAAGKETYKGSDCLVYRGAAHKNDPARDVTFEFWLDLSKDLAVTRYKWSICNQNQATRILEVELKKYGERWLPSKGVIQEFELNNGKERLVKKDEMVVNEFVAEQNIPDSLFTISGLDLPSNTIIVDKIFNVTYPLKP